MAAARESARESLMEQGDLTVLCEEENYRLRCVLIRFDSKKLFLSICFWTREYNEGSDYISAVWSLM